MLHVLIFDDSAADVKLMQLMLDEDQNEQYEYSIIEHGSKDIKVEHVDAVIIDYHLPGSNGLEILASLTDGDPIRNPVPAIMITGLGDHSVAVEAMKLGAQDYITKEELTSAKLIRAIKHTINLTNIKKDLIERNLQLEKLSTKDELTGLFNRRYHQLRLEQEVSRSIRFKEPLSLCMIDLDYFKRINDRYGHQFGDEVLRIFAEILSSRVRLCDVLSRIGGDEFTIILPLTNSKEALILAENILKRVQEEIIHINQDEIIRLHCSIGVTTLQADMTTLDFQKTADQALYRAKGRGRNQVCFIDSPEAAPSSNITPINPNPES